MGYTRTLGTANSAPDYCSNSLGKPNWTGIQEADFNDELKCDLRAFIYYEAKLQGHNDSLKNCIGENREFFHADFLSGWPQRMWQQFYCVGIAQHKNVK